VKIIEVVVIFLLLFVILGGMSVPLWWDTAQPYIFGLPGYIEGVIRDMKNTLDYILENI